MFDIDIKSLILGMVLCSIYFFLPKKHSLEININKNNYIHHIEKKYKRKNCIDYDIECSCQTWFIDEDELKNCAFCIEEFKKSTESLHKISKKY